MKLLLVPHFYMIGWAKRENELFYKSGKFAVSDSYNKDTYMPFSKAIKRAEDWIKKAENIEHDGYFFVNTQDYIYSDMKLSKPIYGVIHGSRMLDFESGNTMLSKEELRIAKERELVRFKDIDFAFTVSQSLKDSLTSLGVTCEMQPCGSPIFVDPYYENDKREFKILWGHRLTKQKNPSALFKFPEEWRRRMIISTPLAFSAAYSKQLKENENIMEINRDNGKEETYLKYREYLKVAKYGISFSHYESFGNAVSEGLISGVCYLCPNHPNVPFAEFVHPEALYDGSLLTDENKLIAKIIELIEKFEANESLRLETIAYARERLERYYSHNWLNNIVNTLYTR